MIFSPNVRHPENKRAMTSSPLNPRSTTLRPIRARTLVSRYVIGILGVLAIGGAGIGAVLTQELETQETHRRAGLLLQSFRYSLRFDLLSGNFIMTEERLGSLLKQSFKGFACVDVLDLQKNVVVQSGNPKLCPSPLQDQSTLHEVTSIQHSLYYDAEETQPAYLIRLHYQILPLGVPIPPFVIGLAAVLLVSVLLAVSQMSRVIGGIFDRILIITSARSLQELPLGPDPIQEVEKVRVAAQTLKAQEDERLKMIVQQAQLNATHAIQTQVAHDIRSPLSALASIEPELNSLPEETRILIRSSVSRIQDIANQLILRNRTQGESKARDSLTRNLLHTPTDPDDLKTADLILFEHLIDLLLSEKRLQYRPQTELGLEAQKDATAFGAFVRAHSTELFRLLSNLIDNAAEASAMRGRIWIEVCRQNEKLEISICDQGKGIPENVLPKLGQWGVSYDKTAGNGLGLAHAFDWVRKWKGEIQIESKIHKGTRIKILLPLAPAPQWFAQEIILPNSEENGRPTVVILDDDESIHRIWRSRFELKAHLVHFTHSQALTDWLTKNPLTPARSTRFLVDYELIGDPFTGLATIEKLNLSRFSTLVTSHFEEPEIVESCLRLGVPILPKSLAGFVPIRFESALHVLIDDDPLVHLTWKKAAKQKGVTLQTYDSPEAFLCEAEQIPRSSILFVDVQLGDTRGEELIPTLREMGFHHLTLVTGLSPDQVRAPENVPVHGKDPPF